MESVPGQRASAASWPSMGALDLEDLLDELRARATAARESQARLAGLLDGVVAVSADLELSEVLSRIVAAACDVVDAKYGALGVLAADGEHLIEFVTRGVTDAERRAIGDPPRGHGVLGLLIRDPQPRRLRDISAHADSFGFPRNHPQMHSFLGTPIRIRDKIFGNLYLAEKKGAEEFDAEDEAMLVALAAAAGVAIDNARLYEHSQRQQRWSEAIRELTQTLLESEHESAAIKLIATQAGLLSHASMAAVALRDEHDDLVVRAVHTNGSAEGRASQPRDIIGTVIELPLVPTAPGAPDPATMPPWARFWPEGNPVENGTTTLHSLALGDGDPGILIVSWALGAESVAAQVVPALKDFAQQAGLALIAARSRRDRSRMALLEDRDRIARDMHDHVIQRLFATGLSLQSAARMTQQPTVRTRLDDAVDDLDGAIKDIRHAIFELHRPPPTGGLSGEIRALAESFEESLGFSCELSMTGPVDDLSASMGADILAVVRESLANVARHAEAAQMVVTITVGDQVSVDVVDDGVGIEPNSAHSGLVNLGSRAAARSGVFTVHRATPQGTALSWRVPAEQG